MTKLDVLVELEKVRREMLLRGFSNKTISVYSYNINKFLLSDFDLSKRGVEDYLLFLKKSGFQEASIRLCLASLRFYFSILYNKTVTSGIPLPKRGKSLPKVLTKNQILRMINVTRNKKHKLIIALLYSSGLRVSELVNLRRGDFDFDNFVIFVRSGKGKKDRITIFSKKLTVLLLDQLNDEFLFGVSGCRLSVKSVQLVVKRAAVRALVNKRVTPHMLRHSFATHLLDSGVSIKQIQKLLGHARLETTNVYTYVSSMNLKNIVNPL